VADAHHERARDAQKTEALIPKETCSQQQSTTRMAMTQLSGTDPTVRHRGVKCKRPLNSQSLKSAGNDWKTGVFVQAAGERASTSVKNVLIT